jgi:hypothetical protein
MHTTRRWLVLAALSLLAAIIFGAGIQWGLPSHDVDPFLFSNTDERLSGAEIDRLAGGWDENSQRAADVAAHPILDRSKPITLIENRQGQAPADADAANRARILLRYRLYSYQPDEMITFRALAMMHPRKMEFDPRLYQYGGLWIYPVGGLLQAASLVGAVKLTTDRVFYLDHPEQFGRLYVVARAYSAAWGVVGVIAVFLLMQRLQGGLSGLSPSPGTPGEGSGNSDCPRPGGVRASVICKPAMQANTIKPSPQPSPGVPGEGVGGEKTQFDAALFLPSVAAICFMCMPAVIDLAHEAKPHLPGAVILLLAILSASNDVVTGKRTWMLLTASLCGAAAAMVLWAAVGFVLIPMAVLLAAGESRTRRINRVVLGFAVAVLVYFAANPYVAIHLLRGDSEVLRSNLANTDAMYHAGSLGSGMVNAVRLIAVGTSWPLALLGVCGIFVWRRARNSSSPSPGTPGEGRGGAASEGEGLAPEVQSSSAFQLSPHPNPLPVYQERGKTQNAPEANHRRAIALMLAVLAGVVLIQFVTFAAKKPGEYARFGLMIDIALMLSAMAATGKLFTRPVSRAVAGAVLVLATCTYGFAYERGFLRDSTANNSRMQTAQMLRLLRESFPNDYRPVLALESEPAPYCLPPVNLSTWKIVLLPRDSTFVSVKPSDQVRVFDPRETAMSWADKPFRVESTFSRGR